MPIIATPPSYETIDGLLDAGELDLAREALARVAAGDESYTVLHLKLSLFDGSLTPTATTQRLVKLMRRQQDWPGAKSLFQIAAQRAYEQSESSVSRSHVPPPVKPRS